MEANSSNMCVNCIPVQELCRICLTNKPILRSIFEYFDEEQLNIDQMIFAIGCVLMPKSDTLPNNICSTCFQDLRIGFSFRKRCLASDVFLRNQTIKMDCRFSKEEGIKQESLEIDTTDYNESVIKNEQSLVIKNERVTKNDSFNSSSSDCLFLEARHLIPSIELKVSPNDLTANIDNNENKCSSYEGGAVIKTYTCDKCNSSFKRRSHFVRHIRAHSNAKNNINKDSSDLKAAIGERDRTIKRARNGKIYTCNECDYFSARLADLQKHSLRHTTEKRFVCESCGSPFKTHQDLVQHMTKHGIGGGHTCRLCHSTFKRRSTLSKHMHAHSVTNYACTSCDRVFIRQTHLDVHLKSHGHAARKYSCQVCEYTCAKRGNLVSHMVRHVTDKNYTCDKCGNAYKRKHELSVHEKKCEMRSSKGATGKSTDAKVQTFEAGNG